MTKHWKHTLTLSWTVTLWKVSGLAERRTRRGPQENRTSSPPDSRFILTCRLKDPRQTYKKPDPALRLEFPPNIDVNHAQ